MNNRVRTAAIIGSFRKFYKEVCDALKVFNEMDVEVTSPKGTPILEEGIPFVRFESDLKHWDDPLVQTVALHRILRADLVYVVAPKGYVGRTTCYEIGRIIQNNRPLYFSEIPNDLPILIPHKHVIPIELLSKAFQGNALIPHPLFFDPQTRYESLELDLTNGTFRTENEINVI